MSGFKKKAESAKKIKRRNRVTEKPVEGEQSFSLNLSPVYKKRSRIADYGESKEKESGTPVESMKKSLGERERT